jgi:Rieske Fe-S protein
LAELQKDPITRGDFLGFGVLGAIMGAILTIPPAAFVLSPVIKTDLLGQSDVPDEWAEVGPVSEVPAGRPKAFTVRFPLKQVYSEEVHARGEEGEEPVEGPPIPEDQFTVDNAIWLSWKTPIKVDGELGRSARPAFLDDNPRSLTQEQRREVERSLNVLSSSCAHLGCPVRWEVTEDRGEFLCPCHGGLYDINGEYVGGPPPRGLFRYTKTQVRENGRLYVKHEFDAGGQDLSQPYVV